MSWALEQKSGLRPKSLSRRPSAGTSWALLQERGRGDASLPRRPRLTGRNVILPQGQHRGIRILRSNDSVKHTADYFGSIVLVRSQDIGKLPVQGTASGTFKAPDDADVPLVAFIKHNSLAGVPVDETATAARAGGGLVTASFAIYSRHRRCTAACNLV